MDNKNLKGIIELGNLTTKCLIFNINIDNEYEILSTSIASKNTLELLFCFF